MVTNSQIDQVGQAFVSTNDPTVGFQFGTGFNEITTGGNDVQIYQVSDVSFAASVSAVPLPASAPLFGAALLALGVGGYRLKRKKIATA